jgi:hypothetical protein
MRATVEPAHVDRAAPAATTFAPAGLGRSGQALAALSAMIFNRELVITTGAGRAGTLTIVARANGSLLGSCSEPTTAFTAATCRVSMRRAPRDAFIAITARLLAGHKVLGTRHVSGVALPTMKMAALLPNIAGAKSALSYICSPALRVGGPGAIS